MKKKLILFMPSFEGGGVEKNLFLIANFFIKKIDKVSIITVSKKYRNRFNFIVKKYHLYPQSILYGIILIDQSNI